MTIDKVMRGAFSNPTDIILLKKQVEKEMILHVYAPLQLRRRDCLVKEYKKSVSQQAKATQEAIALVTDQLDNSIRGQWSKAIRTAIRDQSQEYDNL